MGAFYYDRLNGSEQTIYRRARRALTQLEPAILAPRAQRDEVSAALRALLMDDPALFWFQGRWRFEGAEDVRRIAFAYSMSQAQVADAKTRISEVVKPLLLTLDASSKRLALYGAYRWLLANVEYAEGPFAGQTLFDALIARRAVCKGLSKAFSYFAEALGCECILREGTLDQKTRHIWNAVRLEDQWLNVDVSLGYSRFDFLFAPGQQSDPCRCFLVSDEALKQTHIFDDLPI